METNDTKSQNVYRIHTNTVLFSFLFLGPPEGQTCMKTSALSAILASCGLLIAALCAGVLAAARGCRREERTPHHAYVPHKGRIK